MNSLRARLLAAATLTLTVFVAVTGVALIEANRERALLAQQERMQGLVYGLLGAADVNPSGEFSLAVETLAEPRLLRPASGLEATVFDDSGTPVWRSPSSFAAASLTIPPAVGDARFEAPETAEGRFTLDYGVRWYSDDNAAFRYTIRVSDDAAAFFVAERAFAQRLWLWLLVPSAALLLAQLAILAWALRPLRRMEREVSGLQTGHQQRLGGGYPRELKPLRDSLNALLDAERSRRRRYSDALGDLSHSLKTPLAAARSFLAQTNVKPDAVAGQLDRMNRIIRYQLARAAAQAPGIMQPPVTVLPVARRLCDTLSRVYPARALHLTQEPGHDCTARIEEDALFELLGNLLDNACKWARRDVRVTIACHNDHTRIDVDDDGPGFPDTEVARWLARGARADQQHEGQGLGLAVCHDVLRSVGGELALEKSPAGGARVIVRLPA